jgi:hypothetical protein
MKAMKAMTYGGGLLVLVATAGAASAEPERFETPEAAVAALVAALEARDRDAVLRIFGPENEDVVSSGDQEEDRALWGEFLSEAQRSSRIDTAEDGRATLFVGRAMWPFPADIVEDGEGWSFDAEGAREEVLARRIGGNELAVIGIMRRAGVVQAAYRLVDHDGDGVMEFAAAILSSPGARDGLFWPDEEGTEPSPFGDVIARASLTGFALDGEDLEPEPFEGYYFHILQGQGPAAPGGAYSYMIEGNMVAGHALLAVPAAYFDTGIMTFMVGENGIVYETDLGEEALSKALEIDVFDPNEDWNPAE